MIWNSQHGFVKWKSYVMSLIALYDELTGSVDEERVVDVVYLDFSKALKSIFCNTLVDETMKY